MPRQLGQAADILISAGGKEHCSEHQAGQTEDGAHHRQRGLAIGDMRNPERPLSGPRMGPDLTGRKV